MTLLRSSLAAIAIGLLAAACAPAHRGEAISGPLDVRDPLVARGQALFDRHCHQCHPGASAGLGPSVMPIPSLVRLQVRLGLGAMPAFDRALLPDEDLDALIAYVARLRDEGIVLRSP